MSALFAKLRTQTRPLHSAIEQAVGIARDDAPLADYHDYLARLLGYLAPLEDALAATPGLAAAGVDLRARRKAHLLRADLLALQQDEQAIERVPRCRSLPRVDDVPSALGVLYVLESATLGGEVLYRRWARRFPDELARASSYLRCYGDETMMRWRALGVVLKAPELDDEQHAVIVRAAIRTLETLRNWLTGAASPQPVVVETLLAGRAHAEVEHV